MYFYFMSDNCQLIEVPMNARTATVDCPRLLDGLLQHTERVVWRSLGLVQDLLSRSSQHDRARLTHGNACSHSNTMCTNLAKLLHKVHAIREKSLQMNIT